MLEKGKYFYGKQYSIPATVTAQQQHSHQRHHLLSSSTAPVSSISTSTTPRPSILKYEGSKPRIATCMFICGGNVADIGFVPCGHRLVCSKCCGLVKPRRCAVCYTPIQGAKDLGGKEVALGERMLSMDQNVECAKQKAADAARREIAAKHDPEIMKLREQLEELELRVICQICMDQRNQIVFQCGHKACIPCAQCLKQCHMCRREIVKRIRIYQ